MKTIHHAMILSPLLFMLGCAVTADDAQESTSQTDDSLSLTAVPPPPAGPTMPQQVNTSPPTPTPSAGATVVGHTCNIVGTDGSTQGVHCADLAFVQLATEWEWWPTGQAYCQTPSGVLKQCASIRQNIGLFAPGTELSGRQVNCGHFGGSACPATVRFQNSGGHVRVPFAPPGSCYEIWASMINDQIQLPVSDQTVGPGPNVATAHQFFCTN